MPDLWQDNRLRRQLLAVREDENTLFSASELAEISAQLREIKEVLRGDDQGKLTANQLESIEARLDEAEEASHRIDRKHWWLMLIGLIFTLTVTDAVPPDVARHVLYLVLNGLAHLFGGGSQGQFPAWPAQLPGLGGDSVQLLVVR